MQMPVTDESGTIENPGLIGAKGPEPEKALGGHGRRKSIFQVPFRLRLSSPRNSFVSPGPCFSCPLVVNLSCPSDEGRNLRANLTSFWTRYVWDDCFSGTMHYPSFQLQLEKCN